MNIFENYLNKIKEILINESSNKKILLPENLDSINVEIPPSKFNCDLSTNAAMVLSKINKMSPQQIGEQLKILMLKIDGVENVTFVKPGFLNLNLSNNYWNFFLKDLLKNQNEYGINKSESKKKYLIEFVSANPTGPLHVGHCRGAILGDVISNLLIFNKHHVTKEYYVNDYGNQINSFTKSVFLRIREIKFNEKFPYDNTELYPGDYVKDIAENIIKKHKNLDFEKYDKISEKLTVFAINESLSLIKNNLKNLGIYQDNFVSEKSLVLNNEVEKVIDKLKSKNLLYSGLIKAPERIKSSDYKEREQLLFKSTSFGDDKDRALQKSDLSWTYFASDSAYHNNKLERNYDILVNILGSDHTGYIKRITSLVEALSGSKNKLICKVSQLVKLIKDGKPFKMSKRKGDYITVEDLINEVGKDATRFIMLNRSSDVELDFDFTKVKEKSKDNPIYYVQYCYARIFSVFRNLNKNIDENLNINNTKLKFSHEEIKVFRKISEWPKCVELSIKKLEPHRITTYLYELSSEFHHYWNLGKSDKSKRFIDEDKISMEKIIFLKSVQIVIKNGMNIIGVDTPEKM